MQILGKWIKSSHHEKNRKYKGGGQSHYDRVKDFCCRLNERAFMVRLGSDEYTGEQVESIIMRAMEYQAKLFGCGCGGDEAMERIQSYIDAMCFYFAGGKKGSSLPSCSEEEFIDKIRKGVADRLLSDSDDPWKGFNRTEIKLLSTWVRDRKSLSGFVRLLKSYEGEKGSTIIQKYIGAYYKPYAFIESVLESLK